MDDRNDTVKCVHATKVLMSVKDLLRRVFLSDGHCKDKQDKSHIFCSVTSSHS